MSTQQAEQTFWGQLFELFRLSYDPFKDKDELPVRGQPSSKDSRVSAKKPHEAKECSDGKTYARKTTTQGGVTVFELDSTDVRTSSNVPEKLTDYDLFVFGEFKSEERYRHFDLSLYRLIKKEGFSKCINGEPMGYRKAAKVAEISNTKGCSSRYVANYYKAMHIAFNLQLKNAPLPQKEEEVV